MNELGKAYDLNRAGRRAQAVTVLRTAAAERREEFDRAYREYAAVVEARGGSGDRSACYVSRVLRDLLKEALHAA